MRLRRLTVVTSLSLLSASLSLACGSSGSTTCTDTACSDAASPDARSTPSGDGGHGDAATGAHDASSDVHAIDASAHDASADVSPDASTTHADSGLDSGGPADASADHDDAASDAGIDAAPLTGLRLLAPLSTSRVTARRPTLRWLLPTGVTDATVDLCHDRACASPIQLAAAATGTTYVPTSDLPIGVVYWRVHAATLTSPTWQLTVGVSNTLVDTSWGTTLDVNGDGYPDLAVTAEQGGGAPGDVYIYLGGATGLAITPALTLVSESVLQTAVASAGDVNGDGYADLIVGSVTSSNGVGQAFVFLGGAAGLAATPAVTITSPLPMGTTESEQFGSSVASAGDVNGDGYADVIVGAPGDVGYAFVYLGSATGPLATAASTLTGPTLSGGFSAFFGLSVAGAGDLDGDGYGDVVVGAEGANRAYVYSGSAAGLGATPTILTTGTTTAYIGQRVATAGDVNGDGYADVVVGGGASTNDSGGFCIYLGGAAGVSTTCAALLVDGEPNTNATTYFVSVASAGDVNGDGYSDVLVGKPGEGTASSGITYLYLGSAAGLDLALPKTLTSPDGAKSYFGASLTSLGDLDGDGYDDIAIAADDALYPTPVGGGTTGKVHVYRGGIAGPSPSPIASLSAPGGVGTYYGMTLGGATN